MHDGRRSSHIGAARGAGILSELNSNSWGYEQRVRSRVERSAVVIDARGVGTGRLAVDAVQVPESPKLSV
jgi:hypothetical protein